jgi:hypothetical protein
MLDEILRFAGQNRASVGTAQLDSDNSFSRFTEDLDNRNLENPSNSGVRMIEHEGTTEFTSREGEFSSLEARSTSAHTVNLARLLGLPENETFEEGLRTVELKRVLENHYDIFENSDTKMPVYVPERVESFMDLRLSPELEADGEYPCTMMYNGDSSVPVFLRDFSDLIELLETDEYRRFHQSKDGMAGHQDYEEVLDKLRDIEEDGSLFAIPHIYGESDGIYYPQVQDVTLVNVVDNVFTEEYDSSYLDRTGNASADAMTHQPR